MYSKELKQYWHNYYIKNKDKCLERSHKKSRSWKTIVYNYVRSAQRRNIKMKLSKGDIATLISSPCAYCGDLSERFNGIDRINNNKDYSLKNCVSCCWQCNKWKSNLTIQEFENHISKIYNYKR